jgi:hypothetical protein
MRRFKRIAAFIASAAGMASLILAGTGNFHPWP